MGERCRSCANWPKCKTYGIAGDERECNERLNANQSNNQLKNQKEMGKSKVIAKAEIEDKVKGIFSEVLGESKENLKADENFREEYGADSLDALEIAVETEKIFAINISDSEMEEVDTINKMVDVVARKKEENGFNVLKD